MLLHVPRLVTIEAGSAPGSLCLEEILSLVNEIAELTVGTVRFVLRDGGALDTLLRAAEHAQYRNVDAIISLPHADEHSLQAAREITPAAIALPLQSHREELAETAAFAAIARQGSIPVELETHVTVANATQLVSIASVATALHAQRWRVDFSAVKPHPSAAGLILAVVERGGLAVTVHALPQLRLALLHQMTTEQRVPDLRMLSSIDRVESMHVAHDGAVIIPRRAHEIAGSVRRQTIAGIFNSSPSYLRLRLTAVPLPQRSSQWAAGRSQEKPVLLPTANGQLPTVS